MSDATQQQLIQAAYLVLIAAITAWGAWKSQQAKTASTEAKNASRAASDVGEKNATAIGNVQVSADKAATKAQAAVVKAQEAVAVTEAGNRQVEAVHTLVNGQRDAMLAEIAELKAENRRLRGGPT